MKLILLVDFGSTYTKATMVDAESEEIVGKAQAPTTAFNMKSGLDACLAAVAAQTGCKEFECRLACSSAAGGLRMVTVGLVPELTAEAARRAALGAGAKVVGAFSYELTREHLRQLEALKPDIVILAGGIDGGNKSFIVGNAERLAASDINVPIIVAGNESANDEVIEIMRGKDARVVPNVMPEFGVLQVGPAQDAIRRVFIERIVRAKGLERVQAVMDAPIIPTPTAVLRMARLLAEGCPAERGIGDLMIVDVGGATTDVYSAGWGRPSLPGVTIKGLPETYAKRTVEGDLGIRHNAAVIAEGIDGAEHGSLHDAIQHLLGDASWIPVTDDDHVVDRTLASQAVRVASKRHAGCLQRQWTPLGEVLLQYGKDLTQTPTVIGAGGIFAYGRFPFDILRAALFDPAEPDSLRPKNPTLRLDYLHIIAHMGLLSSEFPELALRIAKRHLNERTRETCTVRMR